MFSVHARAALIARELHCASIAVLCLYSCSVPSTAARCLSRDLFCARLLTLRDNLETRALRSPLTGIEPSGRHSPLRDNLETSYRALKSPLTAIEPLGHQSTTCAKPQASLQQSHRRVDMQVNVLEFKERKKGKDYVKVELVCENKSQKGILLGAKGSALKALATAARADIEDFLGRPVYLDVFVRADKSWRSDADTLRKFGY